jgi:hypothetical protein
MSASAWTAKKRSNTLGVTAKVQYSNATVTTNALLYRGVAGCGAISYEPLSYQTYSPCRRGGRLCSAPVPLPSIFDGGGPSSSPSATYDGGTPSGSGSYTYDGGSP